MERKIQMLELQIQLADLQKLESETQTKARLKAEGNRYLTLLQGKIYTFENFCMERKIRILELQIQIAELYRLESETQAKARLVTEENLRLMLLRGENYTGEYFCMILNTLLILNF